MAAVLGWLARILFNDSVAGIYVIPALAGAIDFYGPELGLPKAISGHQNYYLWGLRGYSAEVVIAIGMRQEVLRQYFEDVDYTGQTYHRYAMTYENTPIYVCLKPKVPLQDVWEEFMSWN